ncbi:MAG: DUF3793 family protein [Clostridia bacterium]|nr:DUF3793 family protein [Clostridia bacterium]
MSERMLIQHCSPTLAGLKTGNLFSCSYQNVQEMRACLRTFNRRLGKKGLRVLPVKYHEGRALIYVYRPKQLARDLYDDSARQILGARGYSCDSPEKCIVQLVRRLQAAEDFPHEIGLFLGYPPEDVSGFIEGADCKYSGCWKVYGDEEQAKALFAKYKKCTAVYARHWENGRTIEKLTVGG